MAAHSPYSASRTKHKTSWEPVSKWYGKQVGTEGHYYHQKVVLPGLKRLLNVTAASKVLDLACGNGVLVSLLPKGAYYQGLDISKSLVQQASTQYKQENVYFGIADVSREKLPVQKTDFTHGTIVLALQNIQNMSVVLENFARHLQDYGKLVIVLNHPAFRIPRQSSWEVNEKTKYQSRKVDRYMSELEIPITAHPGQVKSAITWSYHRPLKSFFQQLKDSGFVVREVEEWTSDKVSEGAAAKMENRSRAEFPLFLTIVAYKLPADVLRQMK